MAHTAPSPRARKLLPRDVERESLFIRLTLNKWSLDHMLRTYHLFKGDLVKAMVLGEITHHNLSTIAPALNFDRARVLAALTDPSSAHKLLPCNAFSVSQATGIPRETVRRKIEALVAEGLLSRSTKGDLFVQTRPGAYEHLYESTRQSAAALIEVSERIWARTHPSSSDG